MEADSAAQRIRDRGWIQGAVLDPDAVEGPDCHDQPLGWLLVSQSCDLIHHDFEQEPFAEVIPLRPIPAAEEGEQGNLLYGKNPRILSLEGDGGWFQIRVRDLQRIRREILADMAPLDSLRLEGRRLRMVCDWLAKRYIRPALPDAFNARMQAKPHGPKIRNLLKKRGHVTEAMLMTCVPFHEELEAGSNYSSILWVVMRQELYKDPERRRNGETLVEELSNLLESVPGIKFIDCDLRCESEVTLDDLRQFVRWDFDDLTHRTDLKED